MDGVVATVAQPVALNMATRTKDINRGLGLAKLGCSI
jgi:hypothetical protein